MILNQVEVEQIIDREARARFLKELVVTRIPGAHHHGPHEPADVPLAMVRKRLAPARDTRATVLLIHGYGQNRYAWHLPARSFSCFLAAKGFDVYNVDLRGHGRSRHLGARRPHDITEYVREDLPAAVEEIRRISGARPIFLVGHSMGGLLSYAASPSLGDAVGGIVSLGSPYVFTRGSWSLKLLGDAMLAIDKRVGLGHGALGLKAWGEAVRLARVFIESPFFPSPIRGFHPGSMEPRVLGQHMSLAMDAGSITVLRTMFLAAAESKRSASHMGWLTDLAPGFEALDVPLCVIAGTHDDLAPPASVEPAFTRSRARDKTFRVFPQGHIDLIMGKDATRSIWPLVASWIERRSEAALARVA